MTTVEQGSAEVKLRGEHIVIIAMAIRGAGRVTDWDVFTQRVHVADADAHIGSTLRRCLSQSRVMPSEWIRAHMGATDYNARLARVFELSSTRSVFVGMKNVDVDWTGDEIRFGPTRNARGGVFEGLEAGDRGHQDILLSFEASDDELGWALREALRRSV